MPKFFSSILIILFLSLTGCSSDKKERAQEQEAQAPSFEAMMKEYNNNPIVYIPSSIFPVFGNASAKVRVDVFFDPWCPPCRYLDGEISTFLTDSVYAQKVAIYFHLFPLGDHFPNDKEASLLHLEMAKRNLYKEFRYQVVQQNISTYTEMIKLAEDLAHTKLPLSLLEKNNLKDYNNQVNTAKKDLNLGHTPTIFINNKEYPTTPSIEDFKTIIDTLEKAQTNKAS